MPCLWQLKQVNEQEIQDLLALPEILDAHEEGAKKRGYETLEKELKRRGII